MNALSGDLVLASASPRRADILREAGYRFSIDPAGIDEIEDLPPGALCLENARQKALAVCVRRPGATVVGSDTVVALDDRTFGKPRDLPEARTMLETLAGRTHAVLTAVCVVRGETERTFSSQTLVTFRPRGEIDLDRYLRRIHPLDKAGAYSAQEDEGALILAVEGDFDTVVGLPLRPLARVLAEDFGILPGSAL